MYIYSPKTFIPIHDLYHIFSIENNIIGAANLIIGTNEVCIMNIETVESNKGYGRHIVTKLLNMYGTIKGEATPTSKSFWEKMNATFTDGNNFIIN